MAEASEVPPIRWLFGDAEQRLEAWRYWGRDTLKGVLNTGLHLGMRAMPTDMCSAVGAAMGSYSGRHRYPFQNRRARAAWPKLRPDQSDPASIEAAMQRLWRNAGRTLAELSVLDRLWPEGRITVEGREHLEAARNAGRPLLVTGVHLGNWETIGPALLGMGFKGAAVYAPPRNRFEHRIVIKVRHLYGGALVKPGRFGMRAVYQALVQGGGILMYVDELMNGRVNAPMFGRPFRLEGNIVHVARLGMRTGAAVIPAYSLRERDAARFKVTFLPPVELADTQNNDADVVENVRRLDAIIAPIIRANLDQWYSLFDFRFDR